MVGKSKLENEVEETILRLGDERIGPSRDDFEVVGTFNPGAALLPDGSTLLVIRVSERPREDLYGKLCAPRVRTSGDENQPYQLEVDKFQESDVRVEPSNAHLELKSGIFRNRHISHFKLARSGDGVKIDDIIENTFHAVHPFEETGLEDPRLTWLGHDLYMTYVATSGGEGVVTGLARYEETRFIRLKPQGDTVHAIFSGKDVALFPDNTRCPYEDNLPFITTLIRPWTGGLSHPGISVAWSNNFMRWDKGRQVLRTHGSENIEKTVGTGAPLIKLDDMWLGVFHEVHRNITSGGRAYYRAFFGLDLKEPWKVKYRSEPVEIDLKETRGNFVPGLDYCDYVTGAILREDQLYTYGGLGDQSCSVVVNKLDNVVRFLRDTNVL